MAKFAYKMQNILNIKLRMETQAKTAYAQAVNKVAEEEEKLKALQEQKSGYENAIRQMMSEVIDIKLIQQFNQSIEITKEMIKKQIVELHIANKNLDIARQQLNQAMKERKTQEKLKERAFEDFKQELNAEEKKEIDELVSFNYNNNGEEAGE